MWLGILFIVEDFIWLCGCAAWGGRTADISLCVAYRVTVGWSSEMNVPFPPKFSFPLLWCRSCLCGICLLQVTPLLGPCPCWWRGRDCQSWKCRVGSLCAAEPHAELKGLFVEKGSISWTCPLAFFCSQQVCSGALSFSLQSARHMSNSWASPSPLGKISPWDRGWKWRPAQKIFSFFPIKILARKHACRSCRLYQQQIPSLNSEASSSICHNSAFPAANNFASLVDGDLNSSRWWMGAGEYGSGEIQCQSSTDSRKNGKLFKRETGNKTLYLFWLWKPTLQLNCNLSPEILHGINPQWSII